MSSRLWEFWIDVGGTFTDCLARSPDGTLLRHKLLSSGKTKGTIGPGCTSTALTDPQRQGDPQNFWTGCRCSLLDDQGQTTETSPIVAFDNHTGTLTLAESVALREGQAYEIYAVLKAPVLAIRYLLGLSIDQTIPPVRLRLGTTRGTNALLTRTGANTALVTTRGFGDLLNIGTQERPRLFDLTIRKSLPLAASTLEIDERVAADGTVLQAPKPSAVKQQLATLRDSGVESLAICLLHADLYPVHEQLVAKIARDVGFDEISCSSSVAPLVKIVPRAETTVVDAYLNPVLKKYIADLQANLPGSQIRLMTSAGGLVSAESFHGYQSVLSGPAGGVVGFARAAQSAGFQRAIGFDMGGTSTDVSRFDGRFEIQFETRKAGVRLVAPTLAIDTVAAGGGSICRFDGVKLVVGPESAGAEPGPACYGRGGPLCVTDLNLILGRIAVERFPFQLDHNAAERLLNILSSEVAQTTGERLSIQQLAEGLLQIANANMVRAIRGISVAQGADPEEYVLVSFGGAAAQHACAAARNLGIHQILDHPDAGILSAYGIGQADVTRHAVKGILRSAHDIQSAELDTLLTELAQAPLEEILSEGFISEHITIHRSLDMRYEATDATLNVALTKSQEWCADFEKIHRRQFGYVQSGRPIEIVAARVEAVGSTEDAITPSERQSHQPCQPRCHAVGFFNGKEFSVAQFDREQLTPGNVIPGPALIAAKHATTFLEPGWQAEMLSEGELLLTDQVKSPNEAGEQIASSAVALEIFNNLFASLAEQMGHVLQRTACSVNVKERLDFSCAIFTAAGELVANAPHVPVHLGAMGATVRATLADNPEINPGDVFVSNDPYRGGSHLPDVTVITPVHDRTTDELLFFAACRAHHAEIGGIRPGSMPPNSHTLGEEGVVISNFVLVRNGKSFEPQLQTLLSAGPYPSRSVAENLADIRAQVAANRQGAQGLLDLVDRYTLPVVQKQMQAIQDAATAKVRFALSELNINDCQFGDTLETAAGKSVPIQVKIHFSNVANQPAAVIDFTGTSGVCEGNLNANPAVVTSAVLYVLRLIVDEDIPLNEGALNAVELILPHGLLNPPRGETLEDSPAVAAGNVETSQRVVDVLLGALGLAGASQGTMNNLLFGNDQFGYYETICGGSGATTEGPGADVVQIHMTNTRATDPEVLERRHPVRLWEFAIRRGSGGTGQHAGGNGAVRRLEFLAPLEVSLITGRRGKTPPYGMAGGSPGKPGTNELQRANGPIELLPGICELNIQPGDQLIIKTPGGGGFGVPKQ